jgi:23S rRNA pseudouridine2605 synthase
MRINVYVAQATGLSRRAADAAVQEGRVLVNGTRPNSGQQVKPSDKVTLDGHIVIPPTEPTTILLHKPVGYVCSRDGQGGKTIYELLAPELQKLKPVGRLDKTSSGLLLMTSDGKLANELTHPSYQKTKLYEVTLIKPLTTHDKRQIEQGVLLEDGLSHLKLEGGGKHWTVSMQEGRNRQIRRTFAAVGHTVNTLHRTHFGPYTLGDLTVAKYTILC